MTRPGRLFLTAIDDSFDPACDEVLGPWCFLGREHQVPGWEDLPMEDPFADADEMDEVAERLRDLAFALVDEVMPALNSRHGVRHGRAYWRYVLFTWLFTLCEAAWLAWRLVDKVVRRCGSRPLEVAVAASQPRWLLPDTASVWLELQQGRDLKFWIASEAVRARAPEGWLLTPAEMPAEVTAQREAGVGLTSTSPLRRVMRRLFPFPRCHRVIGMGASSLVFSAVMTLLPRRPARPADDEPTRAGALDGFPPAYVAIVRRLVQTTMPASFTTGYAALEDMARATVRPRSGALRIAAVDYSNDGEKIVAGHAMEGGERVAFAQHGGTYGIARTLALARTQEMAQHAMVTWGWTSHDGVPVHAVPLPSPYLSACRDSHRETAARLILVSSHMRVEQGRADCTPQPVQTLAYRRAKLAFLRALPPELLPSAIYRPYRRSFASLEDEAYLQARIPDLAILDGDLHAALRGVRLLVVDHPGTTLPVAMAMNVPTLCFWDSRQWATTRDCEPVLRQLREVGILHPDPAAAAAAAARVWPDVAGWWRRPEVQAARTRFCDGYARTSRLWWVQWLAALPRL